MRLRAAGLSAVLTLVCSSATLADTKFAVDPEAGNNTFTAVFDAAVGERITAVSSAVGCTLTVDETTLEGKASCSVPLASIRVDNDETKSDHFRQWATNKQVDPKRCVFKLDLPAVKLQGPVEPMKPVAFETEGSFTLCGRKRDDQGVERIQGTVLYLPAKEYDAAETPARRPDRTTFRGRSASAPGSRASTASGTGSVPGGPPAGSRGCNSSPLSSPPRARSR